MEPSKYSLHKILYVGTPLALAICLFLFILTLFFAPFSKLYLLIAAAIGLILSVISIDRFTGGRTLLWLDIPILIVGGYFADLVSFNDTEIGWALIVQFLSVVFSVESLIIILFRAQIENFNQRKVTE
jgi:hypothetical protein